VGFVALVPLGELVGDDVRVTDDGNVLDAKEMSVMKAPQQAVVLSSVVGIGTQLDKPNSTHADTL